MQVDDSRWLELWMDLAEARSSGAWPDLRALLERFPSLPADEVAEALLQARGEAAPADAADERSKRVGPYLLERELGRGGQGVVYAAQHAQLGRRVALKLLVGRGLGDETARLRLEREASVVARLDHPGVGTVFEAGRVDGVDFVAMQLLEGGCLRDALGRSDGTPRSS
ncbi:MAG: hypothetical protein AAFZ65_06825 [Planctomycetota bacterium]